MRLAPAGPRRLTALRCYPSAYVPRHRPWRYLRHDGTTARRHGALALWSRTVHAAICRQRGVHPSRANRWFYWLDFSHTNAAQAQSFRDFGEACRYCTVTPAGKPLYRLSMFRIGVRLPSECRIFEHFRQLVRG